MLSSRRQRGSISTTLPNRSKWHVVTVFNRLCNLFQFFCFCSGKLQDQYWCWRSGKVHGGLTGRTGFWLGDSGILQINYQIKLIPNLTIQCVESVCLSLCQPPLAPSLLHGCEPRPHHSSPWALGTCPHFPPHGSLNGQLSCWIFYAGC